VPGATVARRQLTLRPLPRELLDSLSPEQLRKPMHPAYLLSSAARHEQAWLKPDPKQGELFSKPPADKAPTQNEILRAKSFMQPDRVLYNPQRDGRPPFLKPDANAYPTFSHVQNDSAWLRAHGSEEDKELRQRFYEQLELQGGYEGEDAFGGGAGAGQTLGSASARADELAAARVAAAAAGKTTRGLPASPTDEPRRLSSRGELRRRHPLGVVAAEEAEAALAREAAANTVRLKGGKQHAAFGGFGSTQLPPALFGSTQ
jgi:hypothetical protein